MNIKRNLLALGLLTCTLFANQAVADSNGNGAGGWHSHFRDKMAAVLGLDDTQKEQVSLVMESYGPQMKAKFSAMRDARSELEDAIESDVFDEAKVRAASKDLAASEEELAVMRAKIASQIRPVLTEDQKARAKALKEVFRKDHHFGADMN